MSWESTVPYHHHQWSRPRRHRRRDHDGHTHENDRNARRRPVVCKLGGEPLPSERRPLMANRRCFPRNHTPFGRKSRALRRKPPRAAAECLHFARKRLSFRRRALLFRCIRIPFFSSDFDSSADRVPSPASVLASASSAYLAGTEAHCIRTDLSVAEAAAAPRWRI